MNPKFLSGLLTCGAFALAGCTSIGTETEQVTRDYSEKSLGASARLLASDPERRAARSTVDTLLEQPLSQDDAVRIALAYSPAFQALYADRVAQAAEAAQAGRLANPVFNFERMRRTHPDVIELEIGKMIALPLLDLLFLPQRIDAAAAQKRDAQLAAAAAAVHAATQARQTWVQAVASEQSVTYAAQVKEAADAGAELARRMQAAGNFSKLQRSREQAFQADATVQLSRARLASVAAREALVRALGLDAGQAAKLKLPERLPDLPKAPADETSIAQRGLDERLDVQMARARLAAIAKRAGWTQATSVLDGMQLGLKQKRESINGSLSPKWRGYEIELPLPVFDLGDARRDGARAEYLAALNRAAQTAVDSQSQVREAYHAYRTAFDLAAHYRDEIVPIRKTIAEEMLLKYNGMMIGVFELLADAREQAGSVMQAIEAQRDFWVADAALKAALLGQPQGTTP
jgi:outer membrane protein TolC